MQDMVLDEKRLDSTIYRRVLEYIKKEGVRDLNQFLSDIAEIETEKIKERRILFAKDELGDVIRQNGNVIQFLSEFKSGFLSSTSILSYEFREFLKYVDSNIDKIDAYIENAKLLECLNIGNVRIINKWSDSPIVTDREGTKPLCGRITVYRNYGKIDAISKIYCDKTIIFNNYDINISGVYKGYNGFGLNGGIFPPLAEFERTAETYYCNFDGDPEIIISSNPRFQRGKVAYLKDFGFDSSKFPDEKEINGLEEPKELKLFIHNQKSKF